MKIKANSFVLCSLLACLYTVGDAQDYYGSGGSWRKKHDNTGEQPKDKDAGFLKPSGYLAIGFGFATPEGNFAQPFSQEEYNNQAVGIGYGNFATPGSVFHFSLGFPINHSNFGVALMFGSYTNQYDINNYVNSLANSPISYNAYSNSPITAYGVGGGQNVYSESSIMGGLFVTYPIGRLSIDGRLMLGALLCSLPEQNVFAFDAANDQLEYDVEPSNATSLAYDAGVGARFLVVRFGPRKVCLMVNIDYLYSNVSYNTQQDLYVIPSSGTNAGYQAQLVPSPSLSGKQPIELLNITFGIGYQF